MARRIDIATVAAGGGPDLAAGHESSQIPIACIAESEWSVPVPETLGANSTYLLDEYLGAGPCARPRRIATVLSEEHSR